MITSVRINLPLRKVLVMKAYLIVVTMFWLGLIGCESTGVGTFDVSGNELGSQPVNEKEVGEYNKAVLRCYKTGGTRVVKIEGRLRCY